MSVIINFGYDGQIIQGGPHLEEELDQLAMFLKVILVLNKARDTRVLRRPGAHQRNLKGSQSRGTLMKSKELQRNDAEL